MAKKKNYTLMIPNFFFHSISQESCNYCCETFDFSFGWKPTNQPAGWLTPFQINQSKK